MLIAPVIAQSRTNPADLSTLKDKEIEAFRAEQSEISIDGKLNESVWMLATEGNHFTQRDPSDGDTPTYPTSFRVVYDQENLYVGIRACDEEPGKIKNILTRRDEYTSSDWLYVSIDSYNDNRTAFEFGLNAAGVKHDLRRFDDQNADWDWDAVWEGSVSIDDRGWTAEFKIPFHELRFTYSDAMEWGFQVYREFPRNNNELSVWNYWSKDESGFVSQYGSLKGLSDIHASNPVYVAPYIVGQSRISEDLRNQAHPNNYDLLSNIGGDIRYSFSNGLTLNGTINPDFGQVEADPADYNLTNFETYFSEKRPFFMEGGNILNFSLGVGDGGLSSNSLFYSRRIGRAPHLSADPEDEDYLAIESPDRTNILTATKLTGKTRKGLSVGVMDAVTAEEQATILYGQGQSLPEVIEPMTNYFLARLQQDFRNGQTTMGGVLTSTNRRLDNTGITSLRSGAYTGGIDLNHEFFDRKYAFQAALAFSRVEGSRDAITETQMSSARYFQRPDASHVSVDSNATSLSGLAEKLVIGKIGGGHWRFMTGVVGSTPGFEINDLGFMRQVDQHSQFFWVQYREWKSTKLLSQYFINFNQWTGWTNEPELIENGGNVNAHLTFTNNWRLGGGYTVNLPGLSPSDLRGGPAVRVDRRDFLWTYLQTDDSQDISLNIFTNHMMASDAGMSSYDVITTFRPQHNIQFSLGPGVRFIQDKWGWVTEATDTQDNPHSIFSDMDQTTWSMTIRADYTLRPNLSIQYYAQPFLTAGKYRDYKEVVAPRARAFDDRFHTFTDAEISEADGNLEVDRNLDGNAEYSFEPRDFNYKQFRSNLVLRWEYTSGSILYLVWSQGFTHEESISRFDMNRDIRTLFRAPSDNVLLVKASYLLNI